MSSGPRRYRFVLDADYHQFYIEDEAADVTADEVADAWTEETVAAMLASGRGFVRFGTARPEQVPVEVRVEDAEPPVDLGGYDHVAEVSVEFPSGRLFVAGSTDWLGGSHIELESGSYRVRLLCSGLNTLSGDGLSGHDAYKVLLWRADPAPATVLKRFASS
jgi:hypothetical protein